MKPGTKFSNCGTDRAPKRRMSSRVNTTISDGASATVSAVLEASVTLMLSKASSES